PGPAIVWRSFINADVTSIGNTLTISNTLNSNGRMTSIDDRIVGRASIDPIEPALPRPLPNLQRQVFEVGARADAREIQAVINAAATPNGTRPVVHIPYG